MIGHSLQEAAERAGVDPGYLDRLIGLGLLAADHGDGYTPADVRQVMMVKSLEDGGISLAGIAAAVERGALSFDFLATPTLERLAALASETFGQVSARTGIPLDLLMLIREAIGEYAPEHADREQTEDVDPDKEYSRDPHIAGIPE